MFFNNLFSKKFRLQTIETKENKKNNNMTVVIEYNKENKRFIRDHIKRVFVIHEILADANLAPQIIQKLINVSNKSIEGSGIFKYKHKKLEDYTNILEAGKLNKEDRKLLLTSLTSAVNKMHKLGVYHGDLYHSDNRSNKQRNIFFKKTGNSFDIKFIDFETSLLFSSPVYSSIKQIQMMNIATDKYKTLPFLNNNMYEILRPQGLAVIGDDFVNFRILKNTYFKNINTNNNLIYYNNKNTALNVIHAPYNKVYLGISYNTPPKTPPKTPKKPTPKTPPKRPIKKKPWSLKLKLRKIRKKLDFENSRV
jgi:hypothetical protein